MSENSALPPRRSSKPAAGSSKKAKKTKKPRRWLRILFTLFGLVIVGLAVYVGSLVNEANKALGKVAAKPGTAAGDTPLNDADKAQVKPIALLLLGLDYRHETGSKNTDVIMTAVFNPKSKTATVVSVPRDSLLGVANYKKHKANAYYANFLSIARSKEKLKDDDADQYAREQTRELMSKFFEIPIDYTAVIDFQGFVDVVDALGGVDVYVDQNMIYKDNADGTDINLKKGDQELNGIDALGFVRYRKSNHGKTPESSDFERNDRQSRVLGAIIDRMKSFGSLPKFDNVIEAVGENMRSDIPKAQITNMLTTYFGISKQNVRFIALEGTWRSPYVYLDEAKLEEAKKALEEERQPTGRALTSTDEASQAAQD
ncbi:LCP family protein [Cohnella faecalis]|uniref:LytR family transcriptional regulator n=1 Tax=Cohnella faecalis TaxID=2315694 RepID=A0A398CWN0_9BACL|nr:LCP family protein [Cohnella faecalis]RIE04237.1 LytR family transcriptional regulator [Cohnella faecalis]